MPSKEIGRGSIVRKKACMAMIFLLAVMLLTGCGLIKIEEGERTPLEYTIVKQEEIPAEAVRFMEQKKKKGFQMTYQVEDSMYLMKGYGTQVTGGYSIQVEEVSQSENGVFCKTRLLGPAEGKQGQEPSYPCIVLKIKSTDKPVQFL